MDVPADAAHPDIGQLLGDDAQRAARLVALDLQARVRAAHARLADPDDAHALHDFRVAVRRLRSWLDMDVVLPGKLAPARALKRLRRVSKSTNVSRDHEVLAKWLGGRREALDDGERMAADWLLPWMQARGPAAGSGIGDARHYEGAMDLLDDRLPWYRTLQHVERGPQEAPFAASLAALLRLDVAELRRRVAAAGDEGDVRAIHRVRIAAKRLRYHLEPLAGAVPGVDACLAQLKKLQDLLGDFTDGVVWTEVVHAARGDAPDATIRHGLDRIAARIAKRGAGRLKDIRGHWLGGEPALFAALAAVEGWLDAHRSRTEDA